MVRVSDGSSQTIEIQKTAEPQTFTFPTKTVSWIQIENLVQEAPLGWCALTEVEAFGKDL